MTVGRYAPIGVWIVAVAACALVIARAELRADMTAFLPRSPSAGQRALVDQLRSGVVSRLVLLGIEGAPPDSLAALSRALTRRLRGRPAFVAVDNGEEVGSAAEHDWVWRNRYLLSPGVRSERFTAAGLHEALTADLQLLRSDLAVLVKRSLPSDPTGEILALADRLVGAARPHARDGVWFSSDERRVLLVLETRAEGFDIDAQQQALAQIDDDFDRARRDVPGAVEARLLETGPGVFAVRTRAAMERDATRFSLLATGMVAGLLLFVYRSLRLLVLGLLPVMSGALAGIAAVALGFGFVHGITLGFGVTLIGESVDYAVYLFTQTAPGSSADGTLQRIWPTLRLGVLTSVAGYGAMLFSSFAGFAQLGLFSITGLLAAVSVTRWILPAALRRQFAAVDPGPFAPPLLAVIRRAERLRVPVAVLTLAAAALLGLHHGGFWQEDLSSLSPIPAAEQRLDQELRRGAGAPDVRYLVVLAAPDEQQALMASERVSRALDGMVSEGVLAGFDAPDRYLPSDSAQRARQEALPDAATLRARLEQAVAGLPFRRDLFAPFVADVSAARQAPLLARDRLPAGLALKLGSLVFAQEGGWAATLPLRGVSDPRRVAAGVAALGEKGVAFVDLKDESDRLLRSYQREAVMLALIGSVVVLVLLSASLRSPRRVLAVAAPLAVAVIVTAAMLTAGDRKLSIFNLVGLLLIVAVGSNYCLFFERLSGDDAQRARAVASLVLANLCTVIGFGLLSFSGIPVLHDIGMTVAAGTLACLFLSAILSTGRLAGRSPAAR